jgi:hypothetical protein
MSLAIRKCVQFAVAQLRGAATHGEALRMCFRLRLEASGNGLLEIRRVQLGPCNLSRALRAIEARKLKGHDKGSRMVAPVTQQKSACWPIL